METNGPRPQSTRPSLVDGPMRGRDRAPEAPGRVGASRSAMLYAIHSDPDAIMPRAPGPMRTAGASRCRVGTWQECRFAIARGRWRTPGRTRDCAAAPRSAPTCFAPRRGAGGSAGARAWWGDRGGKTHTRFLRRNGSTGAAGRGDIDTTHVTSACHLTSRWGPMGRDRGRRVPCWSMADARTRPGTRGTRQCRHVTCCGSLRDLQRPRRGHVSSTGTEANRWSQ